MITVRILLKKPSVLVCCFFVSSTSLFCNKSFYLFFIFFPIFSFSTIWCYHKERRRNCLSTYIFKKKYLQSAFDLVDSCVYGVCDEGRLVLDSWSYSRRRPGLTFNIIFFGINFLLFFFFLFSALISLSLTHSLST
jgi:hypothetical protein